ncbi:hypothetical protein AEA42_08435 [Shewanella sp. Sh95]|uniref:haloacid dehalogenase-like hydrolase n=1 Tax=Shewanella sp. Sh95 TaxID=1689868 RepID=UPI0006DAED38|nr:haloacid dehalogenase-like hydrolase [Shewanella sp. Sh95]KPN77499.1 hypothetical protein AEA42_08435 [Shewanella sp. Sh95]
MRCFDFCFTLVNMNTTYSFVDYCVYKSGVVQKIKLFLIKFFSKILLKLKFIDNNKHSKLRISVLKGFCLVDLKSFSREFASILNDNINEEIFGELISSPTGQAIIVSNSLQFVIQDFLDFKGLKYTVIGSSLLVNNFETLGRYSLYIPDKGKVKVLLENFPNIVIDEFFTDDFDADRDLVEYAISSRFVKEGRVVS